MEATGALSPCIKLSVPVTLVPHVGTVGVSSLTTTGWTLFEIRNPPSLTDPSVATPTGGSVITIGLTPGVSPAATSFKTANLSIVHSLTGLGAGEGGTPNAPES